MILFFALSVALSGAPDPARGPFPELKLKDGRVLKNVTVVSAATANVMAKWDGGRGTIARELLPDHVAQLPVPDPERLTTTSLATQGSARAPDYVSGRTIAETAIAFDVSPLTLHLSEQGPRVDLAGQCFIATRGGTNIKIGGIIVSVYSASAFFSHRDEIKQRIKARAASVDAVVANVKSRGLRVSHVSPTISELLNREAEAAWALLPAASASGRTDADGRFAFSHTVKPPYVLFARGSRAVGGDVEKYLWLVASSDIQNPSQVLLSNAELFSP